MAISLVSIAAFLLLVIYITQPFIVDGQSMEPTLHPGNVMIVWKASRSWVRIIRGQYIPKRWSVVVVKKPDGSGDQLIKRVIGLPGERVVIREGKVTIVNNKHPEGFDANDNACCRQLPATAGDLDVTVANGQIFVVGDNRAPAESVDSRASLGTIPAKDIIGQVAFRLYPFKLF
jgi:signal peptidase I